MPTLGPITSTLEAEVSSRLRQQSLVIWLDTDSHYTAYVDQLAERRAEGDFFAPVVAFRGSYLETILALETHGNKETPDLLLIHMPGHNINTIKQTPLLELYRAGKKYEKALDTLVREAATGKVNPSEIESYINHGIDSLAHAEQWLEASLNEPKDNLSQTLIDLNDLTYILDELIEPKPSFKQKFDGPKTVVLLAQHLYRYTGMDNDFIAFYLQTSRSESYSFAELSETFAAWLMCVEYVYDLNREPVLPVLKKLAALSKPLVAECDRLITYMRDRHPDTYATISTNAENRLGEEFANIRPENLGKIDTFQIEEKTVFELGALAALQQSEWPQALAWASSRLTNRSFWLQRNPKRRIEWTLIQAMAQLGTAIEQADQSIASQPIASAHTLRDALNTYTRSGYKVDMAHRQLEQMRSQLLDIHLPHFNALQNCADTLRQTYRDWANNCAIAFARLCEASSFLPEADLQQRTLYDECVAPLLKSTLKNKNDTKVAYFLIDAFRYEMAAELRSELEVPGAQVRLDARYAELPTLTSVGMNVLAPVQKGGQLTLASGQFKGFKSGEYTVNSPASRVRAMSDKSSSSYHQTELITLSDICEKPTKGLKKTLSKVNLAVIHSKEIDDAGEANVGIVTFERWLQQIKLAWNRLKGLGFDEFIFTADHGFLLQDKTTLEEIKWGKKTDPKRRHVLLTEPRKEDGLVSVSLKALGYGGQAGYLHFARGINPFATGKTGASFIHGGNSLQERVIPVLSVSHRHNNRINLVKYIINAEAKPPIAGYSRLQVNVKPAVAAQGVLSFTGTKTISLSLRAPNRPDIDINIAEAPGAILKNQQIQLAVEQDWAEVLFSLVAQQDERVKIEVYQSDDAEDVEPMLVDTYFEVAGSKVTAEAQTPRLPAASEDWQASFDDDSIRQAFIHIYRHNAITEAELNTLLGSPRKVRRFAADFETYLQQVPFLVRVESTASGKRYVKDA